MKAKAIILSGLSVVALASCTAPYGNGTQRMVPRTSVEAVERSSPNLPPAPSAGIDGYNAVQYGLDNRYGGFHGYGRPIYY